jgi:hypothetical protein
VFIAMMKACPEKSKVTIKAGKGWMEAKIRLALKN